MSNGYDWQDEDAVQETNAMRVLREKAEADSALIREMRDELREMREERLRTKAVEKVTAKGLDPKVLDLIPEGTDPQKFLDDYADLFKSKAEATAPVEDQVDDLPDGVPADEAAAHAAVASAARSATPASGADSQAAKIQSFDNAEDLLAYLATQ